MPEIKIVFKPHEPNFGLMLDLSEAVSKCLKKMETPLEGVSKIIVFQAPDGAWKLKVKGEVYDLSRFL